MSTFLISCPEGKVIKLIVLLISLTLLLSNSSASAAGLLVVQSFRIPPYDTAVQGFSSAIDRKITRLVSSEMKEKDLLRKVRTERPDLILAIGLDALSKVKHQRDVPIIHLMVPNSPSLHPEGANFTGIGMYVAPEKQLSSFHQLLPDINKIGILFDPAKSGAFVRKARASASAMGIELIAREVHTAKDATSALEGIRARIQALWIVPDSTVINPGTAELLLLSALESRIPVLAFSEQYAGKGALLSLELDAYGLGRQAAGIAERILAGERAGNIAEADAQGATIVVNLIVAKKLGIAVSSEHLAKTKVIR